MTRKATELQIKTGTQSDDDPFTFVMSDETVDRVGDVIRADGWQLAAFKKNPIALFGHEHNFPIGTWKNVRVEGKRLLGELKLAAEGTSARIDEIRGLLAQRILKAVSVGFRIKEYEPMDEKDPYGAWDIKKAELHETSVVSVPANPSAVMLAKSLGVSDDMLHVIKGDADEACLRRIRAGLPSTLLKAQSQARHATATSTDYSQLLGESSDDIRRRRALQAGGII